jgi:hypothetical protein
MDTARCIVLLGQSILLEGLERSLSADLNLRVYWFPVLLPGAWVEKNRFLASIRPQAVVFDGSDDWLNWLAPYLVEHPEAQVFKLEAEGGLYNIQMKEARVIHSTRELLASMG